MLTQFRELASQRPRKSAPQTPDWITQAELALDTPSQAERARQAEMAEFGLEKPLAAGGGPTGALLLEAASGLPLFLPVLLCLVLTLLSAASSAKSIARTASSALDRGLRSYLGASVSVWLGTKLLKKLLKKILKRRAASRRRGTRGYGSTSALDELDGPQIPKMAISETESAVHG